ncbi:condensin subunit YCS4 [Lachancea thermotolerans CBS 6340]|uniref:Condensin complex subunit 1 n=1 Tax=Lachancea thermotolerans (strain ATCC 56472 / CBS 6340 / NRRL Y-8284) TaxID=559295 RepID=C5DNA3_LACTC|nr:KLTH0G15378p [Lachancea thermotolerans CBS 6340]CAR25264.1 KLTH0G15378p [Lachancea thermotolerans CBS 6340]
MPDFSLSEQLTKFQTSDKYGYPAVENPSSELNTVTDALAVSPELIDDNEETLESLMDLAHGFSQLQPQFQTQLTYLVSSSFGNLAQAIDGSFSGGSTNAELMAMVPQWKRQLEEYGYITHVLLHFLQNDIAAAASQNTMAKAGARTNTASSASSTSFKRTSNQIEIILSCVLKVFNLNISRMFPTTPERDLFIGLFTRPLYVLIETEQVLKMPAIKLFIIKIIGTAVKNHGQSSSTQNAILTSLTYFVHLNNFSAELLQAINDDFDFPQLTEDILRDISNKEFNSKDVKGPKSIATFLVKLSELIPRIVLRQMTLIVKLLNNSSFTLRCAVVEACGNIVIEISSKREDLELCKQSVDVLLELLEERFADSNPYVRTKAIQACLKICDLPIKFKKHRSNLVSLAVRSLQDRSSLVRRNSVKLLTRLLLTHQFDALHGTQLDLSEWETRLKEAEELLARTVEESQSDSGNALDNIIEKSVREGDEDSSEESDEDQVSRLEREAEDVPTTNSNAIFKMKLTIQYYKDAVSFIKSIHEGIERSCQLLFSRNRNEVLEVMDFFVLTDAFNVKLSKLGVRKMLHLVWMKGSNDEGTSIVAHLISCYNQLFLTPPEGFNFREKAAYIAKNLIRLTENTSAADLASLERLLGLIYEANFIDQDAINVLWAIYSSCSGEKDAFDEKQVHGSIIVLGMLSLADHQIALKGLDALLKVGLGEPGKKDLILLKYTCVAIQRMVPRSEKSVPAGIPRESEAVLKLHARITEFVDTSDYYPACEEAIKAIFAISSSPDLVGTEIIREKTMMTFGRKEDESHANNVASRTGSLSQLLFIVGQVAINAIVYLEKCETEFKRRKIDAEAHKHRGASDQPGTEAAEEHQQELEMIGGTNEDDFSDAIAFIKENELLFGEKSLLAKFGPLVEEIVSNNTKFADKMLQRTAVLCLEKFMCVSSKYCENNLPLLITIMEKSPDPIIRSNAILGLGDMAVCFNNLVDENTDFLYRRLHDGDLMVQKTCLMTVTFLILAGQVKVKGQLGQMAKCLENPDQGISDMCKLFFTELATKDNAIYNGFIDIFSSLSNDEDLGRTSFKRILKFLLSFIEKERHQKQLSEKLLVRLQKSETQKQWDDVAFVLNSLPFKSEKANAMLTEGFKMVTARN